MVSSFSLVARPFSALENALSSVIETQTPLRVGTFTKMALEGRCDLRSRVRCGMPEAFGKTSQNLSRSFL